MILACMWSSVLDIGVCFAFLHVNWPNLNLQWYCKCDLIAILKMLKLHEKMLLYTVKANVGLPDFETELWRLSLNIWSAPNNFEVISDFW